MLGSSATHRSGSLIMARCDDAWVIWVRGCRTTANPMATLADSSNSLRLGGGGICEPTFVGDFLVRWCLVGERKMDV